jgi:hypothetical protein
MTSPHRSLFAGAFLVLAICLMAPAAQEPGGSLPDPLPLRRVQLPPDRLARELQRAQQGTMVLMPRADFEARVQEAARAQARGLAPRLTEARYHAILQDTALVGDGQWKVVHAGTGPGLLKLQPLTLALRWVRFENGDALAADFDGHGPAVLVETPGEHTVAVEWSARGEARPEGVQFDLRIPPCPVAVLEVELPANRSVSALSDTPVSGPYPAEAADRRLWKVACGGRSQLTLLARSAAPAGGSPVVVRQQKTTQKLHAEGMEANYSLTLEALPQGVREFVCECDPELRPREVVVPYLDGWTLEPGPKPDAPARLRVRLREPLREGVLQVACLAPLGSSVASEPGALSWRSPGLRLVGGVAGSETLEVWLHPELRVEEWKPGGFYLRESVPVDEGERLTLVGGGVVGRGPNGSPWGRPSARLRTHGVEFRARQLAWWRVGPSGQELTLQIGYEVSHGQLFQLPVLLPAGWEVERVDLSPAVLLRGTSVRSAPGHGPGAGRPTLLVDLTRPLGPEPGGSAPRSVGTPGPIRPRLLTPPVLTIRLRPSRPGPVVGRPLPFPDAEPLGARFREGALAVDFDGQLYRGTVKLSGGDGQGRPSAAGGALGRTEPEEDGPWGKRAPEHYYRYRDRPVQGSLQLEARPSRLRAQCRSEVFVASGRAAVETRLLLEAEVGSPSVVEVYVSAGGQVPPAWQVDQPDGGRAGEAGRQSVEVEAMPAWEAAAALSVLGARNVLEATAVEAARPRGRWWRLKLARPLRAREPLVLRATRALEPDDGRWDVPLQVVLGADRMEGEVALHLAGVDLVRLETEGLHEAQPDGRGQAKSKGERSEPVWRAFRYGRVLPALSLRGQVLAGGRPPEAVIDGARLTVWVRPDGTLEQHYSFRVSRWPQRTLPVRLPAGSRLLAIGVDGHWLPELSRVGGQTVSEEDTLELPVPGREEPGGQRSRQGEEWHRFEICYAGGSTWWGLLGRRVKAAAPSLPVPPLTFQRAWRLAPGLVPVPDDRYRRVPGTGAEPVAGQRSLLDLFRLSPSLPSPWPEADVQDERRQLLDEAGRGLRGGRAGQVLPLREVVALVAFDYLRGRCPLVIDGRGLREAGVGPDTPLTIRGGAEEGVPPWEASGLVAVPARAGVLLTGRRQVDCWSGPELPEEVETAVAAAAAQGQDPSGRFRTATSWLWSEDWPAGQQARLAGPASAGSLPGGGDGDRWGEWESVAGSADEELLLVRESTVRVAGLFLAWLMGLFCWALRRSGERRVALLLLLGAAGLALLWLPAGLQDLAWWPLVAGCVGGLVWYLRSVSRKLARSGSARSTAGSRIGGDGRSGGSRRGGPTGSGARLAGGGTLGLLLLAAAGQGPAGNAAGTPEPSEPAPATVYLVPGSAEAPERERVLVATELLDRLAALARPATWGPRPVLLNARYEGRLVDGAAEFSADFKVQCPGDEGGTLAVPLDGVQLTGETLLDGARAYPVAQAAPEAGYTVPVKGRGQHVLTLHFRVPIKASGADREVRFTVPRLVQNHLLWHVPAGASWSQVPVKYGAQWETGAGADRVLHADLGPVTFPVRLSWLQEGQPRGVRMQARSAHLWDLRVDGCTLWSVLHYRVSEGAVTSLTVGLPGELEVRAGEAHRVNSEGAVAAAPAPEAAEVRLRDWNVTGDTQRRTLHLEMARPVSGEFQVLLELVPRTPLPAVGPLPLPRVRGPEETRFLAYRVGPALAAERDPNSSRGVKGIAEAEFAPFWPLAWPPRAPLDRSRLKYACTAVPNPVLQLDLRRAAAPVRVKQEVSLRVGRQLADFRATVTLGSARRGTTAAASFEGPVFLEWDLQSPQPLTIASVTGVSSVAVHDWKQRNGRLLVWLERPADGAQLELTGWLPLKSAGPGGEASLDIPCLHLRGVAEQQTKLRLRAGRGLALIPEGGLNNLKAPAGPAPEQELIYETEQPYYGGKCRVCSASAQAAVRVLTFAEVRDRRLTFTATVDYRDTGSGPQRSEAPRREMRRAVVRLRNWEGQVEIRTDRDQDVQRSERPRRPGERTWVLDLPSFNGAEPAAGYSGRGGVAGKFRVVLTGSVSVEEAAAGLLLPDVDVPDVERCERWVAVAGGELMAEVRGSLDRLAGAKGLAADWPGEAERVTRTGGEVWQVKGPDWEVRLLPRDWAAERAPVRTYLAEQSAAVVDGQRWLHEVSWWLRHESHTDLGVRLPAAARVVSVSVDGVEGSPLQSAPDRLWLPLPGRAGVRQVRVRWQYLEAEPLDRPNLSRPEVEGAVAGPTLWTVRVPAGWEAEPGAGVRRLPPGTGRVAAIELARAEAQLQISRALAEQTREAAGAPALAAAQKLFALSIRRARRALEVGGEGRSLGGPDEPSLSERLQGLEADNRALAVQYGFEEVVREAEKQAGLAETTADGAAGMLPAGGTPVSWLGGPKSEAPRLHLLSAEVQRTRLALATSGQWLGGLVVLWAVSLLPVGLSRLRLFWPEQMALLGALGWHLVGPTFVVLFLLLLGVCGRALHLAGWLRSLLRRRAAVVPTGPSSNGTGS